MFRALVLVVLLSGCGRYGYDPLEQSGGPEGTPGALPMFAVFEVEGSTTARGPRVAALSDGAAVTWTDDRSGSHFSYLRVFDSEARPASDEIRVGQSQSYSSPGIAWTGTEIAVLWRELSDFSNKLWLSRFAENGSAVGTEQEITGSATGQSSPALAWSGSALGGAWPAFNAQPTEPRESSAWFAPITASGERAGPGGLASWNGDCTCRPDVAWGETGWGVVTANDGAPGQMGYGVGLARFAADGAPIGEAPVLISPPGEFASTPSIAASGSSYGIAWPGGRGELLFRVVDTAGNPRGEPVELDPEGGVANVAWVGTHFLVAWAPEQGGTSQATVQWVTAQGVPVSDPTTLSSPGSAGTPEVSVSGGRAWLVWASGEDPVSRLYLAYLDVRSEL